MEHIKIYLDIHQLRVKVQSSDCPLSLVHLKMSLQDPPDCLTS